MDSGKSMVRPKRKWCTSECTDQDIRQLTIRYPFSTALDIRSRLPPEAGSSVSPQNICNRLHEVQLRARVTSLVLIDGHLTVGHYVTRVEEPIVLPLLQGTSSMDLVGRDMKRGPLAQTMDDLRTVVDVAWQRLPQETIN
ncbi:hypothetical protein TNCV_4269541 [Trichonephila clavipes]|nr:hypothetical protein TNCV_4269541 [Trichonephila clavipes]